MLVRSFLACLALTLFGQTAIAQTQRIQHVPAPPANPNFVNSSYYQDDEEEEDELVTDQEALAKQMDEFHKRLKELEAGAESLKEDQSDGTFADRLKEVEEIVEENVDSIGDIDSTFDDYVKNGHGDNRLKLYGRVHVDYWHFPSEGDDIDVLEGEDPQDRVEFRRMRFGVSGNVDDNMLYKIEIEFAGGNNPSYRDAYLGWDHLPYFNRVLIGNQKRPYGLDHLNSSRYNVFIERPFVVEAFNQDSRRLGITSYGVSDDLRHNWRYGLYHMELTQNGPGFFSDNVQPELAGRWATTWWYDECSGGRGYGHFAVSGSVGAPDGLAGDENALRYRTRPEGRTENRWLDTTRIPGADKAYLAGVEGVLNVGAFQLTGEYLGTNVDRLNDFGSHVQFHGGYIQASYFLTGEHTPWDRKSGTLGRVKPFENFFAVCDCDGHVQRGIGAWQLAARYSYLDLSDEDIDGGRGRALTLALNWHWNAYARFQMNYIVGDIESNSTVAGDYQIIGTRFMIDF